jgi:hypothetical protein
VFLPTKYTGKPKKSRFYEHIFSILLKKVFSVLEIILKFLSKALIYKPKQQRLQPTKSIREKKLKIFLQVCDENVYLSAIVLNIPFYYTML